MSRALSVLEEFTAPSFIDRAALMLDEGTVFNQKWWEDEEDEGGDALPVGTIIQDQDRNPWQVVNLGSGGTRRLGLRSLSGIQSPIGKGDWSLYGVISHVGGFFQTQTGRAIELRPDGSFRNLAQWEGKNLFPTGDGTGSQGRTQFASERDLDAAQAEALRAQIKQDQADLAENRRQFDAAQKADDARLMAQLQAQREELLMKMENDLKLAAMGVEANIRTTAMGIQAEARQQRTDILGEDPYKFAAGSFGQRTPVSTPADVFKSQLKNIEEFELPQFNPNASLEEIGANIRQMEGFASQGSPFRPPGLEKGGEIGQKGEVTSFKMGRPDPFTALSMADSMGLTPIITGEREGGPELILAPKGTKVIPLTDEEEVKLVGELPGAQYGGEVIGAEHFAGIGNEYMPSFGQFARDFGGINSRYNYRQVFKAARNMLGQRGVGGAGGFTSVGQAVRAAARAAGVPGGGTAAHLIAGALERQGGAGLSTAQSPELQYLRYGALGGQRRRGTALNALRPHERPSLELTMRGIGGGGQTGGRMFREYATDFGYETPPAPGSFAPPSPGAFTGIIYSPLTGVLPHPRKVWQQLRQLATTEPQAYRDALRAYDMAGFPAAQVESVVKGAGITGGVRTGIGLAA
jgi:hypothetical protein